MVHGKDSQYRLRFICRFVFAEEPGALICVRCYFSTQSEGGSLLSMPFESILLGSGSLFDSCFKVVFLWSYRSFFHELVGHSGLCCLLCLRSPQARNRFTISAFLQIESSLLVFFEVRVRFSCFLFKG